MKRRLHGTVVSDKMQKTRVVEIMRLKKHAKLKKYFKVTLRLKVHDEENKFRAGDKVIIEEMRPLSKEKRWKIVEKMGEQSQAGEAEPTAGKPESESLI